MIPNVKGYLNFFLIAIKWDSLGLDSNPAHKHEANITITCMSTYFPCNQFSLVQLARAFRHHNVFKIANFRSNCSFQVGSKTGGNKHNPLNSTMRQTLLISVWLITSCWWQIYWQLRNTCLISFETTEYT